MPRVTHHLTEDQLQEIISSLVGSSQTLEEALPEGFELTDLSDEDHEEIDSEIFECANCGWWYSIEDQAERESSDDANELICTDCA